MDLEVVQSEDQLRSLARLLNHRFKNRWTAEEDSILTSLVLKCGLKKWAFIAKSIQGRNGKQCRDRWLNHLSPQVNKNSWTVNEEWRLFLLHELIPGQWKRIAEHLPGRTENSAKNKWHCLRKTKLREFEARLGQLVVESSDSINRVGFIKNLLAHGESSEDSLQDQLRDVSNVYQMFTPIKKQNLSECSETRPVHSESKQLLFESTMSGRKSILVRKSSHKHCQNSPYKNSWNVQVEPNISNIYLTPIKTIGSSFKVESDSKSIYSINFNSFK